MAQLQKHLISVLMENEAGSLSRVVGLFSQRGYNIDTLNVAATEDPTLSRLTLTTITTADKIEQITKQLHKLIEVVKVQNLSEARRTYSAPKSWTYRQIFIPFLSQGMQAS